MRKFIVSADPGTDDAIALAVMAKFVGIPLAGLASFGNVPRSVSYRNMRNIFALLGVNCPVFPSSEFPLSGTMPDFTDFHGSDGLCGVILPDAAGGGFTGDFSEETVKLIMAEEKTDIVVLGPLTDTALLIKKYPGIKSRIGTVYAMGGGIARFNCPGNSEYNFHSDAEAAQTVIESGLNIVLAPLDSTLPTVLGKEEIRSITGIDPFACSAPDAHSLFSAILAGNYKTGVSHGSKGAVIHDAQPLCYMANSGIFTTEKIRVSVNSDGGLHTDNSGNEITLITGVDKNAFIEMLRASI